MIPLSKHTCIILDAQGRPLPVDPVSVRLAMDAEWSPYIQGRIVVHASDANVLDRARVIVRLRQSFGPDLSIAALTEWVDGAVATVTERAGGSVWAITRAHTSPWNRFEQLRRLGEFSGLWAGAVAAVTAECGGSVWAVTQAMRQPGGTYDPPPAQVVEMRVRVRPAEARPAEGLIEYAVESEEIALHDYRRVAETTWESPHTTLRALVEALLAPVSGVLAPSDNPPIMPGATWTPGQSVWDALHPVLEATGYRLIAGEDGHYQIIPAAPTPGTAVLGADTNLIAWATTQAPIYDGAMIEYVGSTPPGYDIYAPPGCQRILHETRTTAKPGPGAAELLTARAAARGRTGRATATSLYGLRPARTITVQAGQATYHGVTTAVSWTYPDSRMNVAIRDLTTL